MAESGLLNPEEHSADMLQIYTIDIQVPFLSSDLHLFSCKGVFTYGVKIISTSVCRQDRALTSASSVCYMRSENHAVQHYTAGPGFADASYSSDTREY